jgi:hypothetical protein
LVLYGFWLTNFVAFNGDICLGLATDFLELAKKQKVGVALVLGHNIVGASLLVIGDIVEGRAYLDQGIGRYDPAMDRPLALRIGQDTPVTALNFRSFALWMLGYPDAACADADRALATARELGHAATWMPALYFTGLTYMLLRDFEEATALSHELIALAEQKGALFWKTAGMRTKGQLMALTGRTSDVAQMGTTVLAT